MTAKNNISTDAAFKNALKAELGITNLEENQYSGVQVYTNYADLPVTGTLLVSYKVANDGTDQNLNGYYHWSGSDYLKDAEIGQAEINDINEDIYRVRGNLYKVSGYINSVGALISNASYLSTDFIPISLNEDIHVTGFAGASSSLIAFFDDKKQFISRIAGSAIPEESIIVAKASIPSNTKYVRGNCLTTTINPKITGLSLDSVLDYTNVINEKTEQLPRKIDLPVYTEEATVNIFDKSTIIDGQYVLLPPMTGTGTAANYSTSDFIPVLPETTYVASGYGDTHYEIIAACYDASKVSISPNINVQNTGYVFTTPVNCAFIKVTVKTGHPGDNTDPNNVQYQLGDNPTTYEPYRIISEINQKPLKSYNSVFENMATKDTKWLIFGDSITVATSWVDYVAELTGAMKIWNRAVSGASFKYSASHDYTEVGDDSNTYYTQNANEQVLCALVDNEIIATPPDIIVVALGTNDGISSLGSYSTAMGKSTLGELDLTLLYEAVRWVFWKLQTEFAGVKMFASLPIQRASDEPSALETMYQAIRDMAKRYGVTIIETGYECGIVKDFETVGANGRYLHDGLHPYNVAPFEGDKLIAETICSSVISRYKKVVL